MAKSKDRKPSIEGSNKNKKVKEAHTDDFIVEMGFEFYEIRDFFLMESFRYAHEAAQHAMAGQLLPVLMKANLPENWEAKFNQEKYEVEEDEVTDTIGNLWSYAMHLSSLQPRSLKPSTELISQDLVGHVIFLAAYIEATLNYDLHALGNQDIGKGIFDALDRTEIIPKALFIFHDKFVRKEITIDGLKTLTQLRNKAIHFRAANYGKITIKLSDLLQMWKSVSFIDDGHVGQDDNTIGELIKQFEQIWIKGKKLNADEFTKVELVSAETYATIMENKANILKDILLQAGITEKEINERIAERSA